MRRATGIVLISLAVVGALGPAAAAPARTVEEPYDFDLTDPGTSAWYGSNYGVFFGDPVVIETQRRERSVLLSVKDSSAGTVSAAVWQENGETTVFCSESERVPVIGGAPLFVQVIVDATPHEPGGCETPAVPTTGTVTAVFGRK
jgi:hypothetical protein